MVWQRRAGSAWLQAPSSDLVCWSCVCTRQMRQLPWPSRPTKRQATLYQCLMWSAPSNPDGLVGGPEIVWSCSYAICSYANAIIGVGLRLATCDVPGRGAAHRGQGHLPAAGHGEEALPGTGSFRKLLEAAGGVCLMFLERRIRADRTLHGTLTNSSERERSGSLARRRGIVCRTSCRWRCE